MNIEKLKKYYQTLSKKLNYSSCNCCFEGKIGKYDISLNVYHGSYSIGLYSDNLTFYDLDQFKFNHKTTKQIEKIIEKHVEFFEELSTKNDIKLAEKILKEYV